MSFGTQLLWTAVFISILIGGRYQMIPLAASTTARVGTSVSKDLARHVNIAYNSCLTNTDNSLHGINRIIPFAQAKKSNYRYEYLSGSTYWINEFLAVGHVMYEIQLLQVLHNEHVDRIVLQRAPCATHDLCRGPSTYRSWYKGFFEAAVQSADITSEYVPGLYFHFNASRPWDYVDIGATPNNRSPNSEAYKMLPAKLPLSNMYCFDKVFIRKCQHCFFRSIDKVVATKFKEKVYKLFISSQNTQQNARRDQSLHVLIARRNATREMTDSSFRRLISAIKEIDTLDKSSSLLIDVLETEKQFDLPQQVRAVVHADVVITTHGGFESNMIFMRDETALIELTGIYNKEVREFRELAALFGIRYFKVVVSNLRRHKDQYRYTLQDNELTKISNIVLALKRKRRTQTGIKTP